MLALLTIGGGVALLLFGVRYLRKGLDRLFGNRLGAWVGRIAKRTPTAFFGGLATALAAPSSTTISLLAVQAVQLGHMRARQMLVVMLGANIGLTVLVQLVALDIVAIAPVLILVGAVPFLYMHRSRARGVGQVLLSFGFLFLAMGLIRDAVDQSRLGADPDFVQLVRITQSYPVFSALLAALLTILLQSSTIALAVLIGIGAAVDFSLALVIPGVLGANVGMAVTTLLVAWGRHESRRLAVANLLLKSAVAVVVFAVVALAGERLPAPAPELAATWVANLHTGFNIVVALVGLPLVGWTMRVTEALVPEPPIDRSRIAGPKFVHDGPIGGAALAMGQSAREIMHMSEILRGMLDDIWLAMKREDDELVREVAARDDRVDELDAAIKRFLTRIPADDDDTHPEQEKMRQLRCLNEFETIGDVIDKNIAELALKKIRLRAEFSREGEQELDQFHAAVVDNFETTVTAFASRDPRLAQQVLRSADRLAKFEQELRDRHFVRLNEGQVASHETSAVHLDLLTHLQRIDDGLAHIGAMLSSGVPAGGDAEGL